jgi:hypothetical protein
MSLPIPVMTLNEAVSRGLKRYYTGRPCKRGPLNQRNTLTGACISCIALYQRERREQMKRSKTLEQMGFVAVTVRVPPDGVEFIKNTAELLNMEYLKPNGVPYIKLLQDYAQALKQSGQFD